MSQQSEAIDLKITSDRTSFSKFNVPSEGIKVEDNSTPFSHQQLDVLNWNDDSPEANFLAGILFLSQFNSLKDVTWSIYPDTSDLQTPEVVDVHYIEAPTGFSLVEFSVGFIGMTGAIHVKEKKGRKRMPEWGWLYQAVSLHKVGRIDRSLDTIYNHIDDLLIDGEFNDVNQLLEEMQVELPIDLLLGVLTVTLPASDKLPSRQQFFSKVKDYLDGRDLLEGGLLLDGLEG